MIRKLVFLAFLAGCSNLGGCVDPPPCIQPPALTDQRTYQIGVSLAATLAHLPLTGSLSTNFSTLVNTKYDTLNDNDKALFLFLSAIGCYLKEGHVGQQIAQQMAVLVEAKWSSAATSTPPALPAPAPAPSTARHLGIVQMIASHDPTLASQVKDKLALIFGE